MRRGAGRNAARSYRVIHSEDVVAWLTIGMVNELLAKAGVDMSTFTEVPAA